MIEKLKTELTTDPLSVGYSGMSDAQAADSLNAKTRQASRSIIPAYEILEAIVPAEWTTLLEPEKERVRLIVSAGQVDVSGANTRPALAQAFGVGTTTRTNLAALQNRAASRADELGLPFVKPGHVAEARR